MVEIWKDIKGYEKLYQGSNLGRIRSMRYGKSRILRQHKVKGYLNVGLYKDGIAKTLLVHRLVWEAFNGEIPEEYEINHINEDKSDNRLENLNLMTPKENINWGTGNYRRSCKLKGKKRNDVSIYLSKPVLQYTLTGEFVREYSSLSECCKINGYRSCSHISECCKGKRKTYKGYIWRMK